MIRILFILFLALSACTSSRTYLGRGQYEMALQKSVKKLRKKPENRKQIEVLREAFRVANQRDQERINYLNTEGNPERWNELFDLYNRLKARQSLVASLPSYPRESIGFKQVNYDAELAESKRKAAEYLYTHARKLLESSLKEDARLAWGELNKIKSFYHDYRDVDEWIRKAREAGTSYALFSIVNQTQVIIPKSYDEDIRRISLSELNGPWIVYHVQEDTGRNYDYKISLVLKVIDISPEKVKEVHYEEKATIKDGWVYKLDAKGNVMKDSLGNDIKMDKMVDVHCKVVESQQTKAAIISGHLNYIQTATGQLIRTEPISVESVFQHQSAIAIGDDRALSKASLEKTKRRPLPFPTDGDIILMTADGMKARLKEIIWNNKAILR